MEQIKELLEILKQTPEMALWAMSLYFLFILMKLASWIFALKTVAQQLIKRFFDYKDKKRDSVLAERILSRFENNKIDNVESESLIELIDAVRSIKGDDYKYIHQSSMKEAIKAVKDIK